MNKRILTGIIAGLAIVAAVLVFQQRSGRGTADVPATLADGLAQATLAEVTKLLGDAGGEIRIAVATCEECEEAGRLSEALSQQLMHPGNMTLAATEPVDVYDDANPVLSIDGLGAQMAASPANGVVIAIGAMPYLRQGQALPETKGRLVVVCQAGDLVPVEEAFLAGILDVAILPRIRAVEGQAQARTGHELFAANYQVVTPGTAVAYFDAEREQ